MNDNVAKILSVLCADLIKNTSSECIVLFHKSHCLQLAAERLDFEHILLFPPILKFCFIFILLS